MRVCKVGIWRHNLCLMSLILTCNDCTDFGFTGFDENANQATGYSIQRLNRLKFLDLKFIGDCSNKVTERSFAEFTFPDLFGLKLNFFDNEVPKWREIIRNLSNYCSPKLEGLKCEFRLETVTENDYIELLDLCRKLKNLRCLEIMITYKTEWNCALFRHIFKCCPTLRFFSLDGFLKGAFCYFDHVKQEMITVKTFSGCTAFTKRIDTFLMDWQLGPD